MDEIRENHLTRSLLIHIAAIASTAVFVALLWGHIAVVYSSTYGVTWQLNGGRALSTEMDRGRVGLEIFSPDEIGDRFYPQAGIYTDKECQMAFSVEDAAGTQGFFAGFSCWQVANFGVGKDDDHSPNSLGGSIRFITFPYWFIQMMSGAVPVSAMYRSWHHCQQTRRRKLGLCPRCGYDSRASPDRCSECGMTLATRSAARQTLI